MTRERSNQNVFRIANEKTTFPDAFAMADRVLYSGVACITDLIAKEGLINLDFADKPSKPQDNRQLYWCCAR